MLTNRRLSSLEVLESRINPAGNVLAGVVNGELIITGDAEDNAVELIVAPGGSITVKAADEDTTINGSTEPFTLSAAFDGIRVSMGDGDDLVRMPDITNGYTAVIRRDLRIAGGDGDNTVELLAPFSIVEGNLIITNGDGDDRTEIREFELANSKYQKVQILNGDGNSIIRLGEPSLPMGSAPEVRDPFSQVFGDILITNGVGAEVSVDIANVASGSLRVLAPKTERAHIRIGEPLGAPHSSGPGKLQIVTGPGHDEIEIAHTGIFGKWNILTGKGDDKVSLDGIEAWSKLTINTGAGADVVKIETLEGTSTPSMFRGTVNVQLGGGDDLLRLGGGENFSTAVELYKRTSWNGGSGRDRLELSNVVTLGAAPSFTRFETFGSRPLLEQPKEYQLPGSYWDVINVVTADLNGDGILDLAGLSDDTTPSIRLLLGNGDGTFTPGKRFEAGATARGLSVGDFDGKNGLDLVVTNSEEGVVSVFLNDGAGSFGSRTVFDARSDSPVLVEVADYNGDTKLDLAVLDARATSLSIHLGAGDGTFSFLEKFVLGTDGHGFGISEDIAAGDINGDGKMDLVAVYAEKIGFFFGKGDGTFNVTLEHRSAVGRVELSDMNNDGKLDLLVQGGALELQLGNGNGTFQPSQVIAEEKLDYLNYGSFVVEDFNQDGIADILVPHREHWNTLLHVLLGKGDGTFQSPLELGTGMRYFLQQIAVGDFDRDGSPDIAALDYSLVVLLNRGNRF